MAREREAESVTECMKCCHLDLDRVGGPQMLSLQNLRHEHFLSFDNSNELRKHLKFVHPENDSQPMIDSIVQWYRMRKS